MLEKARGLVVDEVVLDLEDAVPAAEKTPTTRARLVAALREDWRAGTLAVRVNSVVSPWFEDDIVQLLGGARERLHAIVVPKVESAETVRAVDRRLGGLEEKYSLPPVEIEAQIETALGLTQVEQIAAAAPRLAALVFGAGDYAASIGVPQPIIGAANPGYPGDQWHYARARIAVAAHAHGLSPIDTPYAAFQDRDGLMETARHARALGFVGKWVIHPDQIGDTTRVFTPSDIEIAEARRILELTAAAAAKGRGAVANGGAMIDEASRRAALAVLARAEEE